MRDRAASAARSLSAWAAAGCLGGGRPLVWSAAVRPGPAGPARLDLAVPAGLVPVGPALGRLGRYRAALGQLGRHRVAPGQFGRYRSGPGRLGRH